MKPAISPSFTPPMDKICGPQQTTVSYCHFYLRDLQEDLRDLGIRERGEEERCAENEQRGCAK